MNRLHHPIKSLLLTLLCGLLCLSLQAQDTNRVRQHLNQLCSPAMHGRGYAYHGDSIAASYLRDQFQKMDVQPYLFDDYYHHYTFNTYAMEGSVEAALNDKSLTPWEDFSLAPYSESAHNTYTLLPVTADIVLDGAKLQAFCDKHYKIMKSCLLYLDMTAVTDKDQAKKLNRFLYSLSLFNGKYPFRGFAIGVEEIPVWSFAPAHQECQYILSYLKNSLVPKRGGKLFLSYTNQFIKDYPTQNVCAVVKGTEYPDSLVIIGGHYDHLGQMGSDVLFPGCHDNASGTATVLEMAHYFKAHPLRYSTVFLLFSGEEAGLMGSSAFVRDSLLDFSKVKLMLNLDLLCGGDEGFTIVNATGDNTKDFFNSLVDKNENTHWVAKVNPRKNAANSDHYPFSAKGMPAVFLYTMGGKVGGYHAPSDLPENASLSAFTNIFNLLIYGLENIK
ncbi:MAG: M28 family peptidase [Bacteroidales bacterium]|nr:M28 family peptidase [Bacteroidales bacterium]